MRSYHPLVLIVLVLLLASSAAGSGQASALPAQPELQTLPAWEYHGAVQGEWLGIAVAGAGKVNGDAYADILVGANKGGVNREGWAGLFLGSAAGPQDVPAWQVYGEQKGGEFGGALDIVGDVNNDGYDDIVVGAPNYTGAVPSDETGEGVVYAWYGSATGPSPAPNWTMEGDLQGVRMGAALAGGYINGDPYADVIVGMPDFTNGDFENAGAAFVYFGSAAGLNTAYGWLDYGGQESALFGLEVNAAGDVNGDGYGDVLVGEPYRDNDIYIESGAVYLYLGNQFSLSNVPAWSYLGYRGGDHLGLSAASAGDLNNDGCDDIAIGAPGYNAGGMLDTGRVFVFYGCQNASVSTLNLVPDWEYSYPQANANTGIDVSRAGDTNHDGYAELLVGMYLYDDEQSNEGAAMVFFGSAAGLPPVQGWQVEGNKNDTYFGYAVDGAGDTNSDGFADVLIGSPQYRSDELFKGAAFVYFGTPQTTFYYHFLPFIRR